MYIKSVTTSPYIDTGCVYAVELYMDTCIYMHVHKFYLPEEV